jgi:arginine/lysine/ornithine decarboxylase
MTTPVHDFLRDYVQASLERAHMPGHKSGLDITEIDGAVDIIKESERNAAELFGAERTLFSCSGSTLAIFAMLSPFAGKRITAVRGCHRSLTDAAILLDISLDWRTAETVLTPASDSAAVFVTSIDYYGNEFRLHPDAVSALGVPLLVDNAHGAYLVFTDRHPIRLGAAVCADSAHKTLPALTGAAYLHLNSEFGVRNREFAEAMSLFGTSSPSYLILDSLDLCNRHIALEKERAHGAFAAVARLKSDLLNAGYSVSGDMLRVTIDTNARGYTGADFAGELRGRGVICEMHEPQFAVLLFSTITEPANTRRVFAAMRDIPKRSAIAPVINPEFRIPNSELTPLTPRSAYFAKKHLLPVSQAIGEIAAGVHVTIPPCAPLIIPGEVLTAEIAESLLRRGIEKIYVVSF